MAGDDTEYEAGDTLDAEAAAFLEREEEPSAGNDPEPRRKSDKAKDEPDFDATAARDQQTDEDKAAERAEKAARREEDRARLMGWAPKDEWQGDPSVWIDAKEFNKRANPAILWERLEKTAKQREKDRADHDATVARLERMNEVALKRQREEHENHIKSLQKQKDRDVASVAREHGEDVAIEQAGKWDAFIEAERQKAPEPVAAAQPTPSPRQTEKETAREAWLKTRPEYGTNKAYQAAVHGMAEMVYQENPDAPYATQLAEVDKRLAEHFPAVYGKTPANGGGVRVNGQGNGAPPAGDRQMDGVRVNVRRETNYASRLNAAERRQGERFVKQGLFKTIEAYAKEVHTADE